MELLGQVCILVRDSWIQFAVRVYCCVVQTNEGAVPINHSTPNKEHFFKHICVKENWFYYRFAMGLREKDWITLCPTPTSDNEIKYRVYFSGNLDNATWDFSGLDWFIIKSTTNW